MNPNNLKVPKWRINHLYKIVDKSGRTIPFRQNKFQQMVSDDPSNAKAILKARQLGISTGCLIAMLDTTMFNYNMTSVILAHENDAIIKLFRIITRAYKFMDERWKPRIERGGGSKNELYFPEINSRIYCDLESRGDTIRNLHVSEYGLMKDDSRVRATIDAVPIDGKITYESTPFGINHFYELWFDTNRPEKKFFFPWYLFGEYQLPTKELDYTEEEEELIRKARKEHGHIMTKEQIAFRRWKISQKGGGKKGTRDFIQEFPEDEQSCFLTSGNAVFDLFDIRKMLNKAPKPIKEFNGIKIYKEPDRDAIYVVGADCAEGVGGDLSFATMINARTREVVATLKCDLRPSQFADKIFEMCQYYKMSGRGWPKVAVERNNHGHAVLLQLEEVLHYPNLYYRPKGTDANGNELKDERAGWVTDKITRPIMVNAFIDGVSNEYFRINDEYILNECLTLVNNEGKIEAADGKHDDSIIASAIAFQVALQVGNLTVYDNLYSKIKT